MPITTALCNSYKQEVLAGTHGSGDTYKLALIKAAPAGTLDKSTTNYSQLGADEVVGTGYSAGGVTLSGFTIALTGDTASIDWADAVWASATFSADGALLYNASKSNKAVCVIAFGSTYTATNGTFTAQIPGSGVGLVRVT